MRNTRATSVRGAAPSLLLLVLCVGGFVGLGVLGCGQLVLGVSAAKTTIGRFQEFWVLVISF